MATTIGAAVGMATVAVVRSSTTTTSTSLITTCSPVDILVVAAEDIGRPDVAHPMEIIRGLDIQRDRLLIRRTGQTGLPTAAVEPIVLTTREFRRRRLTTRIPRGGRIPTWRTPFF